MKNLKYVAVICMAAVAFAACDSDNNDVTELPEVFTGKRLVKIENSNNSPIVDGSELTYSNGKLVGFSIYEIYDGKKESNLYKISYSGNTVTVIEQLRSNGEKEESVYTLNADGYAVSMTHISIEEYEDKLYTETYHCTFEYNDGYLVKIVDEEGPTLINYQDGDVVSYSQMGKTYQCTASAIPNKGGVLPFNGWLDDAAVGELFAAHYAGILGKPTKHLLATEGTETYSYVMDGEYVKTCTSSFSGGYEDVVTYTFN